MDADIRISVTSGNERCNYFFKQLNIFAENFIRINLAKFIHRSKQNWSWQLLWLVEPAISMVNNNTKYSSFCKERKSGKMNIWKKIVEIWTVLTKMYFSDIGKYKMYLNDSCLTYNSGMRVYVCLKYNKCDTGKILLNILYGHCKYDWTGLYIQHDIGKYYIINVRSISNELIILTYIPVS